MTERTFDLSGSSHSNLQALEARINNALKLGFFLDSEKKKSLFRVILLFLFVSNLMGFVVIPLGTFPLMHFYRS